MKTDGRSHQFLRRTARIIAVAYLVIFLGAVLVLLAWWGARVTRRYMNREPVARSRNVPRPLREDDWADKPLYPEDEELP